jgi:hypothetical protein
MQQLLSLKAQYKLLLLLWPQPHEQLLLALQLLL